MNRRERATPVAHRPVGPDHRVSAESPEKRTLNRLEQGCGLVQAKTWPEIAKIARHNFESLSRIDGMLMGQPAPQRIVDDIPEGPPRTARFSLEFGSHVAVQRQCRSHALMLPATRDDLNTPGMTGR